jgi:hypothetical protein
MPGLAAFRWSYATAGSSEGLFHLLADLRTRGTTTIRVLDGEYEGYGAWAGHLGLRVEPIAIDAAAATAPDPAACWFVSSPSAREGNRLPARFVAGLADAGHRIVLDAAYLGATEAAGIVLDARSPAIEAVVLSLSKPYGLFRWRIGYLWSRTEIPSLFATKWFKDVGRHLLGLAVLERVGPARLWPAWVGVQRAIVHDLRSAYDAPIEPSDALLLAHLPVDDLPALPDDAAALLRPYVRGSRVRLCLTPYFEALDPVSPG